MASSLETLRAAIETELDSLSLGGIPIYWPGETYSPTGTWANAEILWNAPAAVVLRLANGTVRVEGVGTESGMSSGGSGVAGNLLKGTLQVRISEPVGSGLTAVYTKADTVRDGFTRKAVGAARFLAPSGPKNVSDATWSAVEIDCPFEVREA